MNKHGMIRLMPDEHDLAQWKLAWDLQDLPLPHGCAGSAERFR